MTEIKNTYSKKKKHILIVLILIVFNIIGYNLIIKTGGYNIDGEYVPYGEINSLRNSIDSFLIVIPIVSLFLGFLIALFPFKQLTYWKKYLRGFLLSMLAINGLFSFMLLILVAMTAIGWYPPEQEVNPAEKKFKKEQQISQFKNEVEILIDSTNFYFDWGLQALENGENPEKISKIIDPKLLDIRNQLNTKSFVFYETAMKNGMTEKEYEQVSEYINELSQPLASKNKTLEERGVELN
jgi:hypothetical protein